MDWMDFVLKFSGEALVVLLAVSVAVLNFFYFAGANGKNFQDSSLASNFLSHHIALNPKLYDKNSSIVTVVSGGGFFPEAQADDFTGLSSADASTDASDNGSNIVLSDDNGLIAPSPDSIQGLIDQAVQKIYTTQAGDTLASIAAANNISENSIIWSNPSLNPNTSIQPGWSLIIPPVDGVAVIADSNTTLPDLAVKYNPDRYNPDPSVRQNSAAQLLATIISYNGLDSAEDINAGDFIVIPGGVVATPPVVPTPTPKSKPKSGSGYSAPDNNVTSVGSGYNGAGHYFPVGYCTYYVATQMNIDFGGNAKNWLANARASGYVVKGPSEPAVRTAVVFSGSGYGRYGHVAYVEAVGDGTITVSEMNFDHFNRIDDRTISTNDPAIKGYIYP